MEQRDPEAPADLDEIARSLHLAIGRIARVLRRSHQRGELTLSEASLLSRIESDGPTTPGALAEVENVRPQAVAATLASLESMGYVQREPDPHDGRRAIVSLSAEGAALRTERRTESTAQLAQAIAELAQSSDIAEVRDAIAVLTRLADAL